MAYRNYGEGDTMPGTKPEPDDQDLQTDILENGLVGEQEKVKKSAEGESPKKKSTEGEQEVEDELPGINEVVKEIREEEGEGGGDNDQEERKENDQK